MTQIAAQLLATYPHGHDAQGLDRIPDQHATERSVRRVLRRDPDAGPMLTKAATALDARTPGPGSAARRWVPGLLRWLSDGTWRNEAPPARAPTRKLVDQMAPWTPTHEPPDPQADRELEDRRAAIRGKLAQLAGRMTA